MFPPPTPPSPDPGSGSTPDPQLQIDLADQIWVGVDPTVRRVMLYLTKQQYVDMGFLPGIGFDELQLVRFIGLCQQMLTELRKLPLEPRYYP